MTRDYHDGSLPVNYGRASGWFDAFPKDPKVVESFLPNISLLASPTLAFQSTPTVPRSGGLAHAEKNRDRKAGPT
jgi:hypothetical protein